MNELEHESLLKTEPLNTNERPLNISELKILRKYRLLRTDRIVNLVLGALPTDLSEQFHDPIDVEEEHEQDPRPEQRRDDQRTTLDGELQGI